MLMERLQSNADTVPASSVVVVVVTVGVEGTRVSNAHIV